MGGCIKSPGAKSASDAMKSGAYFLEFAKQARNKTNIPLMLISGFKTYKQAKNALEEGFIDVVGIARALVLKPELLQNWQTNPPKDPVYPRFDSPPEGGITAWFTMRMTDLAKRQESDDASDLKKEINRYEARDSMRSNIWNKHFNSNI